MASVLMFLGNCGRTSWERAGEPSLFEHVVTHFTACPPGLLRHRHAHSHRVVPTTKTLIAMPASDIATPSIRAWRDLLHTHRGAFDDAMGSAGRRPQSAAGPAACGAAGPALRAEMGRKASPAAARMRAASPQPCLLRSRRGKSPFRQRESGEATSQCNRNAGRWARYPALRK